MSRVFLIFSLFTLSSLSDNFDTNFQCLTALTVPRKVFPFKVLLSWKVQFTVRSVQLSSIDQGFTFLCSIFNVWDTEVDTYYIIWLQHLLTCSSLEINYYIITKVSRSLFDSISIVVVVPVSVVWFTMKVVVIK